jgi:hypothetical protein
VDGMGGRAAACGAGLILGRQKISIFPEFECNFCLLQG